MAGQRAFQFKQKLTCSQNDSLLKRNSVFVCEHRIYAFSSDLEAGGDRQPVTQPESEHGGRRMSIR